MSGLFGGLVPGAGIPAGPANEVILADSAGALLRAGGVTFASNTLGLASGLSLQFGTTSRLQQFADNRISIHNGTAAQGLEVFNTRTDASNFERGVFRYVSNTLQIGHEAQGTGNSNRAINFLLAGFTPLAIDAVSATFNVGLIAGTVRPQSEFVNFDLGASGAPWQHCFQKGYHEFRTMTAPGAAPAGRVRLYSDTSGGKVRLMAHFPMGAAQVVATEP